jgi:hypothetical protein
VQKVESRDLDAGAPSSARLLVAQPYVAVADPSGGKKEEPGAPKRRVRSKRGEEKDRESTPSDRSLAGLLTEALGSGTLESAGTPPRWLALGVGTYLSARVEPRSRYYQQLRQAALANFEQGWKTKANEALGGAEQISPGDLHAVGFALVEAMMSTELSRSFPAFVKGLLRGGEKLDDVLEKVYDGATREGFVDDIGDWVAARYGQLQ